MIRRRPASYDVPKRQRGHHSTLLSYDSRRRWRIRIALAVIIVAGLVIALIFPFGPRISLPNPAAIQHQPPLAIANLSASGVRTGVAFAVNNPVSLSWSSNQRAEQYRLQVAVASTRVKPARVTALFRHPLVSVTTKRPLYFLNLARPGVYYWRVQGKLNSTWTAYSVPRVFSARVSLARPSLLSPPSGARVIHGTQFCWSPVAGATAYVLKVAHQSHRVKGTCASLNLAPGSYMWSAAAVAGHVVGPAAPSAQVTVYIPQVAARPGKKKAAPAKSHHATTGTQPVSPPAVVPQPVFRPTTAPAPAIVVPTIAPRTVPAEPVAPAPVAPPPVARPAPVTAPAAPAQPAPTPAAPAQKPANCIPMYTC